MKSGPSEFLGKKPPTNSDGVPREIRGSFSPPKARRRNFRVAKILASSGLPSLNS